MIPQRNISLLANRLAKEGGRRIQESVLERDYCFAWFLSALAESDLKPILVFKGGTALKRCYFDFTLTAFIEFDELVRRLEPVYAAVYEASGIVFNFEREDRQKHDSCYTFYLKYSGPLPVSNNVKVDVTLRERVVYPLEDGAILRGYEEFSDLPENRHLLVYSLEEIAAEKTVALADRARNEPRDLYDLWYLTAYEGVDPRALVDAIRRKLEFRGKPCKGIADAIRDKEARLKALWFGRLQYQMTILPEFDEIFRAVQRSLRSADLPLILA